MKINKPKNKKVLIIATAAVVILAGIGVAAYTNKWWPFTPSNSSKINTAPPTKDQKTAGQKAKQTSADQDAKSKPSGSDQPPAPVAQPGGKSTVTVLITSANQNSNTLQIRSLIEAVNSDGTCTLTFSRSGYSSVTKTANVQPLASSSTCQGFDIATSELAKGMWNISLVFESATLKGDDLKTVDVQ